MMKIQYMLFGLAFAATIGATPCRAQTLKNPGFEIPGKTLASASGAPGGKADIRGQIAEGWADNSSWADVKLDYSLDSASPHSGKLAQKVAITRGFSQFMQPLLLTAGRHRAAVWLRAEPALWVSLTIRQSGAPYAEYASTLAQVGTKWTKVTAAGVTPEGEGMLIVNATGPGSVWIDDASYGSDTTPPVALRPDPMSIGPEYFGLNVCHMHDGRGFLWPALDFGAYRTWDSGVTWALIQSKGRGQYDWSRLDRDVQQAAMHKTQFLLTLGQTPRWASSDPDKPAVYGMGLGAPPADIEDWRAFVRAAATRYKGRIQAYEIWNEPENEIFYTGTPAQMVPLEKATAEVVRSIDPAAIIVTPAISSGRAARSLKWLDDYLSAGGGKFCDVAAYHTYDYPPESAVDCMRSFRALLTAHGMANKPLWNSESGIDLTGRTSEDAVSYVARKFVIDRAIGFQRLYLYAYDGAPFTGLDVQGKPERLAPSGVAYREVRRWLEGSRMQSCGNGDDGIWTCAIQRGDGSPAWIVWNPAGGREWAPPAAWKVTIEHRLSGETSAIRGQDVRIGIAPVMLTP